MKCFDCRRRVQMLQITEDLCPECYKKLQQTRKVEAEYNLLHYGGGGCSEFFSEMDTGPFPLSEEQIEQCNPMRFKPRLPKKEE